MNAMRRLSERPYDFMKFAFEMLIEVFISFLYRSFKRFHKKEKCVWKFEIRTVRPKFCLQIHPTNLSATTTTIAGIVTQRRMKLL